MTSETLHKYGPGPASELEDLFEQATEDVSRYLWAIRAWLGPEMQEDREYLLLMALSSRARSRAALEALGPVTGGIAYLKKLGDLYAQAESLLQNALGSDPEELQKAVETKLAGRVLALEPSLDAIRSLSEDLDLAGDAEEMQAYLREASHSFLLRFQHLARALAETARAPLNRLDFPRFNGTFHKLEDKFKACFNVFHVLDDLFPAIRAREYGAGEWWLTKRPDPLAAGSRDPDPDTLAGLSRAFHDQALHGDCPMSQTAIAYAMDALEPQDAQEFQIHLSQCRACLDLVLDTRLAKASQSEYPELARPLDPAVNTTAARPVPKTSPATGISWNGGEKFSLFSNKRGPALAIAAVLGLLIVLLFQAGVFQWPGHVSSKPPSAALPSKTSPAGQAALGPLSATLEVIGKPQGQAEKALGPASVLRSGDGFKARFSLQSPAYVYVFFLGSQKEATLLFSSFITDTGKTFTIPVGVPWFILDEHIGTETIILAAARSRFEDMDQRLKMLATDGAQAAPSVFGGAFVSSVCFNHKPR